jgi:hypothetical protein
MNYAASIARRTGVKFLEDFFGSFFDCMWKSRPDKKYHPFSHLVTKAAYEQKGGENQKEIKKYFNNMQVRHLS